MVRNQGKARSLFIGRGNYREVINVSAVWDLFDKMSTGDIPEEWAERYEVVLQNDRRILEALLPDRNNEEPRTGSLALLATDFWAVSMDPMEFFEVIQNRFLRRLA
jgi:hypothetical protein